jgi:hypothetical protein
MLGKRDNSMANQPKEKEREVEMLFLALGFF